MVDEGSKTDLCDSATPSCCAKEAVHPLALALRDRRPLSSRVKYRVHESPIVVDLLDHKDVHVHIDVATCVRAIEIGGVQGKMQEELEPCPVPECLWAGTGRVARRVSIV